MSRPAPHRVVPLNLISTPVPVLNTLGLDTRVGLSSDDPVGGRRPSEAFAVYLTIYGADGRRLERVELGEVPPHRRRMFDISAVTRTRVAKDDHLTVVHRVPRRLLGAHATPDDLVELTPEEAEFSMYRSLIEYSLPGGGDGSVIYETPPGLNVRRPGRPASTTLTFTSKIALSEAVSTYVVVVNYSMDASYRTGAAWTFALFGSSGQPVGSGRLGVGPFQVAVVDVRAHLVPGTLAERPRAVDELACFGFVGYSDAAALIPLVVQVAPSLGGVAVEHTHPAQAYTVPARAEQTGVLKMRALAAWKARLGEATR
jgi:hypothetical protein